MDKGWIYLNRNSGEYIERMKKWLDDVFDKAPGEKKFPCPCKKCCNRKRYERTLIGEHLVEKGMDPRYMKGIWSYHGESIAGSGREDMEVVDTSGEINEMRDFLNETFVQPIIGEIVGSQNMPVTDAASPDAKKFQKLLEDCNKELYPGCTKFKKLDAVVKLYQIKVLGGISDNIFSMLLKTIKQMLPDGECLPDSFYETKKLVNELGLTYEKIDCCPNDCMLFWKETSNLEECLHCGASRYKGVANGVRPGRKISAKVLRYFPITPRLQRLYMSKYTAEDMRWHAIKCPKDGFMRHPSDSPAWKHLDTLSPDFGSEIRNVRLGLASDGFNPFGSMSNPHSTWPVVLSVYNLPPWMCMKKPNLLLSLLIPGPRAPGNDIDVFLRPLVDELKELWQVGKETFDVFTNQMFTMKAAVLWTINDFPAYANLSGWSTKGFKACPHCMDDTVSLRLPKSNKECYMGHRRFLPIDHRFRREKTSFDGHQEYRLAPVPLTGSQCLAKLSTLTFSFGKPPKLANVGGPVRKRRHVVPKPPKVQWKKKSIFFELPYWQHLLIRHNLDLMHIEKNVCDSIVGTLLGIPGKTKDGLAAREDLEFLNIRPEQHPQRHENGKAYVSAAPFNLSREEKTLFCKVLSSVRVPDGYSANLSRFVNIEERKLQGLKSHDCHVLMQQFLPLAIRRILPKPITVVLLELSAIFRQLCSKKETETSFNLLKSRIALTLCQLEKIFPPAFFDVMVHLTVHLPYEAAIAGPIPYRWMYPIERFLQTLKNYVRNKARPEGSIAEGYIVDEGLSFCSMYLGDVETRRNRRGRNYDAFDRGISGGLRVFASLGKPLGGSQKLTLESKVWEECHRAVLFNCEEVAPFLEKHLAQIKQQNRRRTLRELEAERNKLFPAWFKEHVANLYASGNTSISEDLCWLAYGPLKSITTYSGLMVNGWRFRIKSLDDKKNTQNCGVYQSAQTTSYSSARDRNPIVSNVDYFGVIKEIYELNYGGPTDEIDKRRRVTLFNCDWVDISSNRGKMIDEYGFTLVNFTKLRQAKDTFILAHEATQVFYVPDPIDKDWQVSIKTQPRDFFDMVEDGDEASNSMDSPLHATNYYDIPNLDDQVFDNDLYIRDDVEGIHFDIQAEQAHPTTANGLSSGDEET